MAVELDPERLEAQENLAVFLLRTNQTAAAIHHFRKAADLKPGNASSSSVAHHYLAMLLATCADPKLRDPRLAVEHAEKAVKLQPQSAPAWQVLGWAQYRAGAWRESIETLEKSCKLEVDTGDCGQWIVGPR
jgi:tetratricopeptide (TPR) repeat protein